MISIQAECVEDSRCSPQSKALSRFELAVPKDGVLKVDVLRDDIQLGPKAPRVSSPEGENK